MAGSGGFGITISAVDNASKTIAGINKSLAAMSAPAERFNKAVAKFGEVSGINRVTEGISSLGKSAADAFRSMDRMGGSMAGIIGAGSIAGMVELTRRWAEFGTQVGQVSYRLNMPVERLGALRAGARIAGVSIAAMDQSLEGLRNTLYDAAFKKGDAQKRLTLLGIDAGTPGHIKDTEEALKELADRVASTKDPHTQQRILETAGVSADMLPIMKGGRAGIEKFEAEARKTGGLMTAQMTEDADKMRGSWEKLGLVFDGIGNRLIDGWSIPAKNAMDATVKWAEENQKLADSIAKIGIGILALGTIKPALWVARLLGIGALVTPAILASPLALSGDAADNPEANAARDALVRRETEEYHRTHPGGAPPANASADQVPWYKRAWHWMGGGGRGQTTPAPASHADFIRKYMPNAVRAGQETGVDPRIILAQAALESNWGVSAPGNNMFGIKGAGQNLSTREFVNGQWTTTTAPFKTFGSAEESFGGYSDFINNNPRYSALKSAHGLDAQLDALQGSGYATAPNYSSALRGIINREIPDTNVSGPGHVQVDVHIKGAPAGTTGNVTSSGPVHAPPPRIESPFPGL